MGCNCSFAIKTVRRSIVFFLILGIGSSAKVFCQTLKTPRPIAALGVEVPTGKELSHVYPFCGNLSIRMPFNVNQNILIGPTVNFTWSMKYLNEAAKDTYTNIGLGLLSEYQIKTGDLTILLGPGLSFESVIDKISPRRDYNGDPLTTIHGKGIALTLSGSVVMDRIVIQGRFNYRKYKVDFGDTFLNEFRKYNELFEVFDIEENNRMDFSSLVFSIGYRL
jgi:hypothetical protein